ncbi:MAG: very short patch repair endonuclease [Limnobacter sp.]|uniref:very short patch repair endonuclease n=1 Tax=Limnobacter sp. TaxID=2003368 RepID=UPI00403822A4
MTDIVDSATRSRMMSGIKARETKPELLVRKALFASGFRYRLHRKDLPGRPDIVLPGRRVIIFVHGCFWHMHQGCRYFRMPASRKEFWEAKLTANAARDLSNIDALMLAGWRVLIVWECTTRSSILKKALPELLFNWIEGTSVIGEFGSGSLPP